MNTKDIQTRTISGLLKREKAEGDALIIAGYFAVFTEDYEEYPGEFERLDPNCFNSSLNGGDIRALTDHNTEKVLGRTTAGTLHLKADTRGLYGEIEINPKDQDAVNLYARVQRGDVTQCSFGFVPTQIETEYRENGDILRVVKDLLLYEVSVCTFPAYESTGVEARSEDGATAETAIERRRARLAAELAELDAEIEKRQASEQQTEANEPEADPDAWKAELLKKIKGE